MFLLLLACLNRIAIKANQHCNIIRICDRLAVSLQIQANNENGRWLVEITMILVFNKNANLSYPIFPPEICDVGWENIPLVAGSEAEQITIIHR